MFKKFISIALIIALVNLVSIVSIFAKSTTEKELRMAMKVKENIAKLGTGKQAKIKLTLKDKTKLEGYVSQTGENSLTVTDLKTGATTEVEYSQIKKVKGNNLSTGAKIAIGVGIGLAILVILVIAGRKVCDSTLCQ